MTSRRGLLDLIDRTLTERLGFDKVTRRADGVIVVAGSSEAFLVQVLVVDPPDGTNPSTFGPGLIDFIRSGDVAKSEQLPLAIGADSYGELFYTSQNGDRWLLVTDADGRQFVRHVPNVSSGGRVELTDLQSFLDREPHSPQNQALTRLLH